MKNKWKFPSQLELLLFFLFILSLVSVLAIMTSKENRYCFPFVHNTGVVQFRRRVWYHPQNNKRR